MNRYNGQRCNDFDTVCLNSCAVYEHLYNAKTHLENHLWSCNKKMKKRQIYKINHCEKQILIMCMKFTHNVESEIYPSSVIDIWKRNDIDGRLLISKSTMNVAVSCIIHICLANG